MKNKNIRNINGFTLVELLATILILAIVASLTIYIAINVINQAKQKSYQVTIANIINNSNNYLLESERLFFIPNSDNLTEYQCITIKDLVDKGYLKSDVTKAINTSGENVRYEDYVYIERNVQSKAVIRNFYVNQDNQVYLNKCGVTAGLNGSITFISNPKASEYAREKEVTITYKLNYPVSITDDTYTYTYSGNYEQVSDDGGLKKIKVTSNGQVIAKITHNDYTMQASYSVTKIDRVGPIIKQNYSGANEVYKTVTIPLKVTDQGIGVNFNSFTKDDVVVTIGGNRVTDITLTRVNSGNTYNLVINNLTYQGSVEITIDKDKVFDKLNNGNDRVVLKPAVSFNNTYKITYDANGGSGAPAATTYTYSESGVVTLSSKIPTRTGYTFKGWGETKTTTTVKYEAGASYSRNISKDVTLYAVWEINKVYIHLNTNGGTLASEHGTNYSVDGNKVLYNGSENIHIIKYGEALSSTGLINYNSPSYLNIVKSGYTAVSGSEWVCKVGCLTANKIYNQTSQYSASNFCDLSTSSCNVTLYVNWIESSAPVATISTTTTLKTNKQTATLKCSDNVGVVSYYWGTTVPNANSIYTAITSTKTMTITKDITAAGTYYLACKDAAQNKSDNASKTYYTYTVYNMREKVAGSYTKYTTGNYDQMSKQTYLAPSGTTLTLKNIRSIPEYSSSAQFMGKSVGIPSSSTSANVDYNSPTLSANSTYTMWFARNSIYFRYKPNGGKVQATTTYTDGTVYTWSVNSTDGLIYKRAGSGATTKLQTRVKYGATTVDLANYNYSKYLYITRENYKALAGAEWICESGCPTANKTFKQTEIQNFSTSEICSDEVLKTSDCPEVILKVNWKKVAAIPTDVGYCSNPTYTGGDLTIVKTAGEGYTWTNGTTRKDAGKQKVTAHLKSGYIWSDNTTEDKKIECSVLRKPIAVPTCASKTYTGTNLTLFTSGTGYTAGGTTTGKNVGTYTATATPTANYMWQDNSTSTKNVGCQIKAKSIAVSWSNTGPFTYNGGAQGPSASVSTGVSGETMTVTATKATLAGTHTSTASCSKVIGGQQKCANYTLTNKTKQFTIVENYECWHSRYTYAERCYKEPRGNSDMVWEFNQDTWVTINAKQENDYKPYYWESSYGSSRSWLHVKERDCWVWAGYFEHRPDQETESGQCNQGQCFVKLYFPNGEAICMGTRHQTVNSDGYCQSSCINATCTYVDGSGSFYYGNIEGGSC